jgi:hypothetical protein
MVNLVILSSSFLEDSTLHTFLQTRARRNCRKQLKVESVASRMEHSLIWDYYEQRRAVHYVRAKMFGFFLVFSFFLGAKSTSILDCVGRSVRPSVRRSVGPSVGPSVRPLVRPPQCAITWKTRVTSRLL